MLRYSVVDDGAYPDSRISARAKVLVPKADKPPDNDMAARVLAYLQLNAAWAFPSGSAAVT